ncbi:MAG: hypothetical protein KDI44_09205 [Thiothrix sp.]|nr:hypothetical protein [Thiothrix sp.]HPQ96460.1 hypothetical protein [Thiolinea sp.]
MADNCCGNATIINKPGSGNCILPIPSFKAGEALAAGSWRCYNGGMYVTCRDFDGALGYPDSAYFRGPVVLEEILNGALPTCETEKYCLCPPTWTDCDESGDRCIPVFGLNECAWDYDPDAEDYRLYTSLKADNHDRPHTGSMKATPTWDGGFTICEYLNRPVSKNLNGELAYPGDPATRLCQLGCDEVKADAPLVIEDAAVGGKKVKLWKLLYAKGLTVVDEKLQAAIDTAKGLYFAGNAIAVKLGDYLRFDGNGAITLQPCPPPDWPSVWLPEESADGRLIWSETKVAADADVTGSVFQGGAEAASQTWTDAQLKGLGKNACHTTVWVRTDGNVVNNNVRSGTIAAGFSDNNIGFLLSGTNPDQVKVYTSDVRTGRGNDDYDSNGFKTLWPVQVKNGDDLSVVITQKFVSSPGIENVNYTSKVAIVGFSI